LIGSHCLDVHPLPKFHLLVDFLLFLCCGGGFALELGCDDGEGLGVEIFQREDPIAAAVLAVKLVEKMHRLRNTRTPHPFPPLCLGQLQVPGLVHGPPRSSQCLAPVEPDLLPIHLHQPLLEVLHCGNGVLIGSHCLDVHPLPKFHLLVDFLLFLCCGGGFALELGCDDGEGLGVEIFQREDTVAMPVLAVKLIEKSHRILNTRTPHAFSPLRLGQLHVPGLVHGPPRRRQRLAPVKPDLHAKHLYQPLFQVLDGLDRVLVRSQRVNLETFAKLHLLIDLLLLLQGGCLFSRDLLADDGGGFLVEVVQGENSVALAVLGVEAIKHAHCLRHPSSPHPFAPLGFGQLEVSRGVHGPPCRR